MDKRLHLGRRASAQHGDLACRAFTYTDSGAGRLVKKLALPNASYISNTYDNAARLSGTYLDNSSNTILDESEYLYNAGNQRIRQTRSDGSYYTNNYDKIGQLVWADSTVASEDRGYLYDAAWNLNQRTNNGTVTTLIVDSKNQLTSVGGSSCTYDNNGNLTFSSRNGVTYSYDDENQLISAETATNWRTEWVYDGRGRVRVRKEYTWNSGWVLNSETRYLYDGMRVIQERNSGNTPTVSYTRGIDLRATFEGAGGIGGLLARSSGYSSGSWSTHHFYHADGGGNVTYMVDGSQAMVASYRYDPFGNTISSSGTQASANMYRFSSKEIYVNSGIYYYGYRFYDPNLQRWLNRDPLGEDSFRKSKAIGVTLKLGRREYRGVSALLLGDDNLYRFVRNSVVNWVDRNGLDIWIGFRGLHQNINVGDPNGAYFSFSFMYAKGSYTLFLLNPQGIVYLDTPPSSIDPLHYMATSRDQDDQALRILNLMRGQKWPYRFITSDCTAFSHDMFDFFNEMFPGQYNPPELPQQVPVIPLF